MGPNEESGSANQGQPATESSQAALDRLGLSRAAQERVLQAFKTALEQEMSQVEPSDVKGYGAFEGATITLTVKPSPQGEWEVNEAKADETEDEVTGYTKLDKSSPKLYGVDDESITGLTEL
jgi:hypothetical protein